MVGLFHRKKKAGEGDLETGGRRQSRGRIGSIYVPGVEDLGEYPALDRYISVYRDERRRSATEEDTTGKSRKKRWWQFGGVDTEETVPDKQGTPESWLETDMTTGIATSEVDIRRKRAGWNELTAEKENMFVKFLGFFTGPILYGKLLFSIHDNGVANKKSNSHGGCCAVGGWSRRLG